MNIKEYLNFEPLHFSVPAPWAGHIPFANWIISEQKPALLVELGAYSGISYMSFCQSIAQHKLATKAWAIDTWQGDPHAGFYSDAIYTGLRDKHDPLYGYFSTLYKSTFDDAVGNFADGSIDLLHIDGLHTYEAVKHDFKTWKRKLSPRAVVLFHDTHVYDRDFGVHRLWHELEHTYPSINFHHSHGLGVLLVGPDQPYALKALCSTANRHDYQTIFAKLGERFESRALCLQLDNQLADLKIVFANEQQAGQKRHEWIQQQDEKILDLTRQLALFEVEKNHFKSIQNQLTTAEESLNINRLKFEKINRQLDLKTEELQVVERRYESLRSELYETKKQLFEAKKHILLLDQKIDTIVSTKSWRWTAWLRKASPLVKHTQRFIKRTFKALEYLRKGQLRSLMQRVDILRQHKRLVEASDANGSKRKLRFAVLTPPHTLFLARLIAERLQHHGWSVDIRTNDLLHYDHDFYFVLCPQIFENLPPGEKRIVYQLEQCISSRWFTDEYLSLLNNSLLVLDYNISNIRFLSEKGIKYPLVYYVPVGAQIPSQMPAAENFVHEILFYGDSYSSPRRQKMLQALQQHYKVEIINDVFGDAIRAEIVRAKLVINLHYYDNALLETPRLQECISLGVRVVSESASNQNEFPQLMSVVRFFEEGSIPDMLRVVKDALEYPVSNDALQQAAQWGQTQFNFHIDRLLLGIDLIGNESAQHIVLPVPPETQIFCLSLPETPARRDLFLAEQPANCFMYDGLRKSPGWVGCGLSYASLARHALMHGLDSITVMEDDVILPPSFASEYALVQRYLAKLDGRWDIFSGLIASVHPDTEILCVEMFEGRKFVTINKMTSTVFNVYNKKFLHILEGWNSDDRDASRNTIDRYIENKDTLRIVVQLPFLTGHREDVDSTLWGFQNTQYIDWIANSEKTLLNLVETWESSQLNKQN